MTRRQLAQVAARAVTITGLLAGCGGGGAAKQPTEGDFCAQKADAECQVTDRCVTDKDACKADRVAVCTAFVAEAKSNGKRVFVAGNISACISKTKAVYAKTSPITPKDLADMDDVCNYVFQGDGEVSVDNCDTKYDCAGEGHLRQDVLRDVEAGHHGLRQPGRHLSGRQVLRAEQLIAPRLHGQGRQRRHLRREHAVPGGLALRGGDLHRPRRLGRQLHVQ